MSAPWDREIAQWLQATLARREEEIAELRALLARMSASGTSREAASPLSDSGPKPEEPGPAGARTPAPPTDLSAAGGAHGERDLSSGGAPPVSGGKRNGHVPRVAPARAVATVGGEDMILLLASGDQWIGFPWEDIERVALSADPGLPETSPSRYSLAAMLGVEPANDEEFAIYFSHDGGRAMLTCERIGDLLPVEAAGPSVERILSPQEFGGMLPPRWEPIWTATGARGDAKSASDPAVSPLEEPTADEEPGAADASRAESTGAAAALAQHGASAGASDHDVAADDSEPGTAPAGGLAEGQPAGDAVPAMEEPTSRPRRAMVAIRYLPARIAVGRALRQQGWEVEEVADLERAAALIEPERHQAVFVDVSQPLPAALQIALQRDDLAALSWIGVGSRLRMIPDAPSGRLAGAPRLFFPFGEEEARALIASL